MKKLPIILLLLWACISCQRKKEPELQGTEKAVILKDSASGSAESARQLNLSLQGLWESRMLCSKAGCGLYVIGDRRNEIWEFTGDSLRVYAGVPRQRKLLGVFRAAYGSDKIILQSGSGSPAWNSLKIHIVLDDIKGSVIKGTQSITTEDNCTSVFDVELARPGKVGLF